MARETYAFFSTETYLLPGTFDDPHHGNPLSAKSIRTQTNARAAHAMKTV
jgi:hypothetical protein